MMMVVPSFALKPQNKGMIKSHTKTVQDILLKGGSPGHKNVKGKKFMSYFKLSSN